jgi:hypothetical protein
VLYPEATPAQRSEREGARATGRKLAEIWWAAKLRPSTPFSLQHRCTVKRYRDERFVLGIMPSASCLRDGDGKRQRRRPSPTAPTAALGSAHSRARRRPQQRSAAPRTAQTATLEETKASLRRWRLRCSRRLPTASVRSATSPRLIFNPFALGKNNQTTHERQKNGEKTERKRPDFNLHPVVPARDG